MGSIKASTPVSTSLDTLEPALSSTVPALMPCSVVKGKQTNTVVKRKDKAFINRMVKTLAKLETKYRVPEHKRKKRLFTRKQKTSPIVPREFSAIYNDLAAPEPESVSVPDPRPQVRWNEVRFKPALPNPELFLLSRPRVLPALGKEGISQQWPTFRFTAWVQDQPRCGGCPCYPSGWLRVLP